ncbi:MAG: ABC transporter permease, partial [Propionicimonas sp.]|nr:ABC transporter permease [Propionicimonas sp.]
DGVTVDKGYENAFGAVLGDDLDAPVDPSAPMRWTGAAIAGDDPALPLLALGLGPFFVALIWLFFPSGGSTTYPVAVVEAGAPGDRAAVEQAITALERFGADDGAPVLEVTRVANPAEAAAEVQARRAAAYVDFPAGFAAALAAASADPERGVPVTIAGDLGNPLYPVTAIMAHEAVARHLGAVTGRQPVLALTEVALGTSGARTEFEAYVPGVLVFAIGLTMFSAAVAVAQEVEGGTVRRLVRTPLRAGEFLGGVTLVQLGIGLGAGVLSLATAGLLGFRPAGPVPLVGLVWLLTCLAVIGIGLVVGAVARSVAQAFLLANFPFGVFMFLSGTMFPIRGVPLLVVAGQEVNLLDVLPPRHAVNALNDLITYGSTDIGYELAMLAALSAGFFWAGAALFRHRHLRAPG